MSRNRWWALAVGAAVAMLAVGAIVVLRADQDAGPVRADGPDEVILEETPDGVAAATFAGGCFWCTEAALQELPGVTNAISGYAGGTEVRPTYEDVYTGSTGHREAVRVYYRPGRISYSELLDAYWRSIDPTDANGQFVDRGQPYTTAVFVHDDDQRRRAEASVRRLEESGRFDDRIATQVLPLTTFYQAEEYHQDFYRRSSARYEAYEGASGREEFKERVWQEIRDSTG